MADPRRDKSSGSRTGEEVDQGWEKKPITIPTSLLQITDHELIEEGKRREKLSIAQEMSFDIRLD